MNDEEKLDDSIRTFKQSTQLIYWIEIFKQAIEEKELTREVWAGDINPALHEAELNGMKAKLQELENELQKLKQ